MNQMKKKGFTLIELLAVIVILAVIALITVPMIRNVIEDTRKGAFKDSVMSAFYEVEYYLLENNLSEIQEGGIEVTSLKLDNNEFEYGIIIQNEEGELEAVNVSDGKYCASGTMTNLAVSEGNCDTENPNVEVNVSGKIATITLTDNTGVIAWAVVKEQVIPEEWTQIKSTKLHEEIWKTEEAGEYYVYVKDVVGNINYKKFKIDAVMYLYNAGTDYTEITGGIHYIGFLQGTPESGAYGTAKFQLNSDHILLSSGTGGTNNYSVFAATTNKINLYGYTKLNVVYKHIRASLPHSTFFVGISTHANFSMDTAYSYCAYPTSTGCVVTGLNEYISDSTKGTITVDIGDYNESYYIILTNIYAGSSYIYSIYLT